MTNRPKKIKKSKKKNWREKYCVFTHIYFEFDETLFHSHAISVSVEVTNIPNHSDYHNIEEIEGGGDPCQKLVLTSTDI